MPRSTLPDIDLHRIRMFCKRRIPEHARDQVRLEVDIDGSKVTIYEARAPWDPPRMGPAWTRSAVASLRYSPTYRWWTLFWMDQNGQWHHYRRTPPTPTVADLLAEIDSDPTRVFWG